MAISVPRQVLERALRNAPLSEQKGPRFGTFAWRSQSYSSTSSTAQQSSNPSVTSFPPPPNLNGFIGECLIIEDNEGCNIPIADPPCSGRVFIGSKTFTNPFINSAPVRLTGLVNNDILLKTTQFQIWLRSQSPTDPACYAGGVDYTFEVGPNETFSISAYNSYGGCKNVNICTSFESPITCLYPASALYDGRLTLGDLPDNLQINPYDLNESVSATVVRSGSIYGPYTFFEGDPDYTQRVTFVENLPFDPSSGPQWVLETSPGEVLDSAPCLFTQGEFGAGAGPGGITDLFDDTYRATLTYYTTSIGLVPLPGGAFGSLPPEFNFIRTSLGTWKGEQPAGYGYTLDYITNATYSGWTINGVEKTTGLQNNPTGFYDLTAVKILIEVTEI
jgi:hypothetical protein